MILNSISGLSRNCQCKINCTIKISAKAGIQFFQAFLDSRFRGSDSEMEFFSNLLKLIIWNLSFDI